MNVEHLTQTIDSDMTTKVTIENAVLDRYRVLSGSDDWYKKTTIAFFEELSLEYTLVAKGGFKTTFTDNWCVNTHDKTVYITSFSMLHRFDERPVFSFEGDCCRLLEDDGWQSVELVIDRVQQEADIRKEFDRTVLPEYVDLKRCPDCDVIPIKTGYEEKDTLDSKTFWSISCPSCHFKTIPKDAKTAEWFWNMMCDVRKSS